MIYFKNKKQKGYALLYAMIITSIISVIVAGLSNLTYKQLLLSSLVKDSQSAFYMADTATECALYADFLKNFTGDTIWSCGVRDFDAEDPADASYELEVDWLDDGFGSFDLNYSSDLVNTSTPCFENSIERKNALGKTVIKSKGYNMCNMNNIRTVQREIEVNYD